MNDQIVRCRHAFFSVGQIGQNAVPHGLPCPAVGNGISLQFFCQVCHTLFVCQKGGNDTERLPLRRNPLLQLQPKDRAGPDNVKQNSVYPVFHQLRDGQQKEKDGPPAADAEADDNGDTGGEQCQERYIPAAVRASLRPSQRRLKEVCADMTAMLQSLSGQIDHLLSAGCLTQMTLLCQLAQPAAVEAAALRVHLWVDMSRVFPKQTVYHAQTLQRPVKAERAQLCKAAKRIDNRYLFLKEKKYD